MGARPEGDGSPCDNEDISVVRLVEGGVGQDAQAEQTLARSRPVLSPPQERCLRQTTTCPVGLQI